MAGQREYEVERGIELDGIGLSPLSDMPKVGTGKLVEWRRQATSNAFWGVCRLSDA